MVTPAQLLIAATKFIVAATQLIVPLINGLSQILDLPT